MTPKVIVIGGGAAGLMAAVQAAERGARVLILEKMRRPGRKIAITGKGRCNLTNVAGLDEFLGHFGREGRFLRQAFFRFFTPDLLRFFAQHGLALVTERGGRVFPASGKACDVLDTFLALLEKLDVRIELSHAVDVLICEAGRITGVASRGKVFAGDAVILATGGASYPATGSTGDGYRLAKSVGHTIVPCRPALVPLETAGIEAGEMEGLTLRNIGVRMYVDGKRKASIFGEMTFTAFGVSGPVILTLSGQAVDFLRAGKKVVLSLDLKPALDEKKLDARLLRDFHDRDKEPMDSVLRGMLPREMVPVCLDLNDIPVDQLAGTITAKQRARIRRWLKDFRLEITRYRPLAEAIVTAGGVATREVEPRTMESRIVRGLYFCGELLDLQADTGGYNLQAAFSTGYLAGCSAAEKAL